MKKIVLISFISVVCLSVAAREPGDSLRMNRLNYQDLNYLGNVYSSSSNPVLLTFNPVHTLTHASLSGHFNYGGFRAIDEAARHNDFSLEISGLKRFGRLSLSGDFTYLNAKDNDHRWNNTLMLSPINPFVIGDSISSDVNLEQFNMSAAASYQLTNRFITALRLTYKTGSLSDQTDPRPLTNAMHFVVNPGFLFNLTDRQHVGISGVLDVYSSGITHTLVDNLVSQLYFLMKGMGDNTIMTNSDMMSYPRDYNGLRVGGSLQWVMDLTNAKNLLEIGVSRNQEQAQDGGSMIVYKAGDYRYAQLSFLDRLTWGLNSNLRNNVMLQGQYTTDRAYWYDQRRKVDTEHGNVTYYEVLNKSEIQESNRYNASAAYRLDKLTNGLPDWNAQFAVAVNGLTTQHYEATQTEQKYNMANLSLSGSKYFMISTWRFGINAGAFYRFQLGTPTFGTVRDQLLTAYTAPTFEYATASCAGFNARLQSDFMIHLYRTPTWVTVYAQAASSFYTGKNKYSNIFNNTSRTNIAVGVELTL